MFRIKLSKFKHVIAFAIVPRIFVRETKPIKSKLNNYTLDVFNFARKSTDSGSKDDQIEKQRQIIEKCFGETPQSSESKDLKDDPSEMEGERKSIERSDYVRMSDAEKCDIPNASDNEPSHETSGMQAEDASVRATTANIAEETLDQKLETIDETPNVEASPQKIEGFNSTPKVLGHDIESFADEKVQKIDLDDLARRCVGAPIGNIDDMLIKEMKNMAINDVKTPPNMNFIKSHCVEKYYSGIFEHFSEGTRQTQNVHDIPNKDIHLFDETTSIGDNEIKSERITPLHIDAVNLFAIDEGSKDFKESGFLRDSPVYLSSEIEEPLLDLPNIIKYESPVMPFYEYVNKKEVILKDFDENETITIAETVTDTESVAEIPRAEEVLLRKEDTEEPSLVVEKHEMGPEVSEPTLSHIVEPNLKNNLKEQNIKRGFGNLSRERLLKLLYLYKNSTNKETAESHVFSTSTEIPPAPLNQSPNSSISDFGTPEIASKEGSEGMEMPPNSAISGNQNPGEYYNMMYLNKQQASSLNEQQPTLTAENHIMHAFCAQLQEMEDGGSKETEDSIMPLEYPVLLRDPFCYILYKTEIKKNADTESLTDKVTAATIENLTDNIKNEDTNTEGLPLSQVLKRIRDKNRLELCRNLLLENAKLETSKKFTCMASMDSNKQKSSPRPSHPPPKPPKEKCPKPCPPPCPPKKDPCAKLIPFFLNIIIRVDVPFDLQVPTKQYYFNYYYKSLLTDDIIERLRKLGETLLYMKGGQDTKYIKDATCAREFDPWIPIPSWPAPKVEKKRPFVCPKKGCKPVPVPRSNPPKPAPCLGVPKKLFSFSQSCLSAVNAPDIIFIQL